MAGGRRSGRERSAGTAGSDPYATGEALAVLVAVRDLGRSSPSRVSWTTTTETIAAPTAATATKNGHGRELSLPYGDRSSGKILPARQSAQGSGLYVGKLGYGPRR